MAQLIEWVGKGEGDLERGGNPTEIVEIGRVRWELGGEEGDEENNSYSSFTFEYGSQQGKCAQK